MMAAKKKRTKTTLKADIFDQLIADDVKKDIDIITLFNDFGVKLNKKGNSYIGLCPFHDDKNPSLSVDRSKGLFNCFGCGESGDVITLVQKIRGLNFKESLEYLKDRNNDNHSLRLSVNDLVDNEVEAPEDTLKLDLDLPEHEEFINLNRIARYYHERLFSNDNALEYLAKRGLKNRENYINFKIGFADGSLLNILSEKQKESLKKSGIIRESGQEHFKSCLVFPVFDELNNVVGIYGRNIDDTAKIRHLYLSGKHRGVFNRNVSKVYSDSIILTESIIDALSLIEMGINNVQSTYGVNGFTDEHLQILKEDRVKEIILAFDADEAGQKAALKLKEKFQDKDIAVKMISPPKPPFKSTDNNQTNYKDWNDCLINGLKKESVLSLIKESPIVKKVVEPKPKFNVIRENGQYIFTTPEITYRLSGIKDIFVKDLRCRIKAEHKELIHRDTVNLYSYRARQSFSNSTGSRLNLNNAVIEKDLDKIIDYLETERDKHIGTNDDKPEKLGEEEVREGMKFLKSNDLFTQIIDDMTTLGYVGEEINKQLLYLCATSRLTDDPISILITSQSASGKSYLVETTAKLIPEDEVIDFNTVSKQALQYMGDRLLNKFMIMGEAMHDPDIEHQIREILSGHKLSRYVVTKNEKTGELTTEQIVVKANVSSVLTTTSNKVNPENASRYFIANTDESQEQTKRIYEKHREKYSEEREITKIDLIPGIIKKHQSAQKLLKKLIVVFPLGMRTKLRFPHKIMRLRRDHERFIDLIAAVCFLRQYQKEVRNNGTFDYIECDADDYRKAYEIMVYGILKSTINEIPAQAVELYEQIRTMVKVTAELEGIKAEEIKFSQRELREYTGLSQMFVKRYVRVLADYEYLKISGCRANGSKRSYSLLADEGLNRIDISIIPTPEEIEAFM